MKPSEQQTAEGILFTDQYQLTMAQLYFRLGLHEKPVQFDHFFRGYPDYGLHQAGYCINAGLEWLLDWMHSAHFRDEDIDYLRGQKGRTGKPRLRRRFPGLAAQTPVTFGGITLRAIPEGAGGASQRAATVVQGPLAMAQILETPLAQPAQLPDPDRHQGRPHPRELAGAACCWSSACAAGRARAPMPGPEPP